MIQQPHKAWRVVLPDRVILEYSDREEAKDVSQRTGGKVQGYVPAQGWIPEKYIRED